MQKKILFVDDEPNILAGLKRMLRNLQSSMDLHFLESGEAALAFLATTPVDVIVTDMRMPGMDGATLLAIVQERYPQVVRFMLSGQSDRHAMLRAMPLVHQFLTKPTSPETLRELLQRACLFKDLISDGALKSLISRAGHLPSLPAVYADLMLKLQKPDPSIDEIAEIIEQDLGMTAKILQLVNSSFFDVQRQIDKPAHAVRLLGMDLIKELVLFVGIFKEIQPSLSDDLPLQTILHHSLKVANFARLITQEEQQDKVVANNAYLAGLLHDIGKLLLASILGDSYSQALHLARDKSLAYYQAEHHEFHADHAAAGGYLLGLWGIPGPVVEAVAFHHQLQEYPTHSFNPAVAVHTADVFYHRLHPGSSDWPLPELSISSLQQAGVMERVDHWFTLCKQFNT